MEIQTPGTILEVQTITIENVDQHFGIQLVFKTMLPSKCKFSSNHNCCKLFTANNRNDRVTCHLSIGCWKIIQ